MSKVVIITEEMGREIKDMMAMTQFKFKANIKKFLAALLEDPTGAEPDIIFKYNGLDKNKLIIALVDNKVIIKKMTIDDHDAEGNPHTARMIVRYSVPKERFNERLDALYDVLFPNADAKINEEYDPMQDSFRIAKASPLTMGFISQTGNPRYGMGKFLDDACNIYNSEIEKKNEKLDEEEVDEATGCSSVGGGGLFGGDGGEAYEYDYPAFAKNGNNKKDSTKIGGNPYTLTEAVTGKDAEKAAAIYAYCLDDKEEDYCILCSKRLEGDEKGKWNPPMGHLHVGESPKDGAVRECEEESGVKIPKSKLNLGSTEDWGKNYWVILDGTIKDWPVGEGDGENTKFEWKSVYGLFWGKDKDLEWAWNTKDFVYKFAPAELDLDESVHKKVKLLTEGKKKNFVNMNVEIRQGGRSAVKMSVDDFKQEMIHAYHQYAMEQDKKYKYELQLTPSPDNFVYSLGYNNNNNKKSKYASALYDDIWGGKYKFDSENVDAFGGIKMSKKGFPYIQCDAGGDWECPVCFFVYFDGNKFRGYVPLKGNALNRNEKHAFSGGGNEPDAKFVQKELGISYEEADSMCGDIKYNLDACLEDFLSRVDVKGTYKKRDFTKDEEEFKKYRKEKIDAENKRREEAERIRQMNAQRDAEELNNDEADINEATATGTGGLPGEFTVPFPMDKKDPSLDRTPGDTMGMHDRVGKSNLEEEKDENTNTSNTWKEINDNPGIVLHPEDPTIKRGEGKHGSHSVEKIDEKRKKVVKNDKGEVVPEFCKKCGGKVGTYICGEPIYKCSECGEYYGTVPFTLNRKKK